MKTTKQKFFKPVKTAFTFKSVENAKREGKGASDPTTSLTLSVTTSFCCTAN